MNQTSAFYSKTSCKGPPVLLKPPRRLRNDYIMHGLLTLLVNVTNKTIKASYEAERRERSQKASPYANDSKDIK